MLILTIKSKDGSECIASGTDNDSFSTHKRNKIDINPEQIVCTRQVDNRIIINFPGRWMSISYKNWNTLSAEEFYKEKFLHAIQHENVLIIE